jgi:hypothetical protein
MTKSRKPFLLRLDPALYEALEYWAQQDLRSVNGQIEFLLKEAVRARDKKALPPDAPPELSAGGDH